MIKRFVLAGATAVLLAAPSSAAAQEFCFSSSSATCVVFDGIDWAAGDASATGSFTLNSYLTGSNLPSTVLVYWTDGVEERSGGCDVAITGFGSSYSFSTVNQFDAFYECDTSATAMALPLEPIDAGAFTGFSAKINDIWTDCIVSPTSTGGGTTFNARSIGSTQYASFFSFLQQLPDCVEREASVSVPAPATALLTLTGLLGLTGAAFRRREDDLEDLG